MFDDDERIEAEDDEAQEYIDELASEVLDEDIEGFDLIRDKEETTENKPENQPSRLLGGIFNTPSVAPSQQVTQSKTQEPVNSGMSKQIEDLTIAISQLMTALSPLKDLNTQGGKLHVTME